MRFCVCFCFLHSVRLQTQNPKNPLYTGMGDCIKKTMKWEGVGGLYKGFISPLWGNSEKNGVIA